MTNHMIDKLLFLVFFVVIATSLYSFFPYRVSSGLKRFRASTMDVEDSVNCEALKQQTTFDHIFAERDEIVAAPLIVRHLNDKGTLLVRYRARKHACTALLIVWSGAKRKSISDSYYDLGVIPGVEPNEKIVEQFLALAKVRIDELAQAGRRKRQAVKEAKQDVEVTSEVVDSVKLESTADQPAVGIGVHPIVELEESPPEQIKLLKFPPIYRGVITEVGVMRQSKGDREFDTFGVRYTTQEGVVEAVFGTNLREALRDAKAEVGDHVEIRKIGRKTVNKGKAPMNLFKVAKLAQPTA